MATHGIEPTVELGSPSNDGQATIDQLVPFIATVTVRGTSAILFKRWSCDDVEEKSKAAKGSRAKKTDNIEAALWKNDDGFICLPGEYLRMTVVNAAKFRQDPRSPRKSAMDLFKAGVVALTDLAVITTHDGKKVKEPEYLDRRRCTVQRAGITRTRPAFKAGWSATIELACLVPEYITPTMLNDVIQSGGRLVGLADFRPTFGRYQVTSFNHRDGE